MTENSKIIWKNIDELLPYERNAKKHPEEQVQYVANSLERFGWRQPVVIDKDGVIVVGHGRVLAAKKLGWEKVPCELADDLTDDEIKAYRLADNKTNESDWDDELLDIELDELEDLPEIDMSDYGFERSIEPFEEETERVSLAERYLVPPFSVLNGAKANWLERKKAWISKGIKSELGRGGGLVFQLPEWMERQSQMTRG